MPAFNQNLLIRPDASIDDAYVARAARRVARQKYGADCTEADVAAYGESLGVHAFIMRTRKLRELGMPADPVVSVAAYGPVGDGVRRSAF
jgi:hypothetical protein